MRLNKIIVMIRNVVINIKFLESFIAHEPPGTTRNIGLRSANFYHLKFNKKPRNYYGNSYS